MNVIFVFTNSPGIGDNIRGLISLLQIQKKMKDKKVINVFVDLSLTLINNCLIHKLPDELCVKNNKIELFIYDNENLHDKIIINFLLENQSNNIYINTNNFPDINNIDEDIKNFIKNIFKFNESFENYFNSYYEKIPMNYNIIHYRFGDDIFINDSDNYEIFINELNVIKNNENYIIISDSLNLKKKIYDIFNNIKIFVFLNKPFHTNNVSDNLNDILNIFLDFFLVTKSKKIYCFSNYRWISNFVLWTSYLYDIPLINFRKIK